MKSFYKRQFHEWANTVSFDEVLEECCEPCRNTVYCLHCESYENVYLVCWKNDSDFYCTRCLKEFITNELQGPTNNGNLRKRFLVFSRDNFKCVYCGRNPREHDTTLEVEHVHPKAKGGTDSMDNLVTACKECNAGKGDILLEKWQKKNLLRRRG